MVANPDPRTLNILGAFGLLVADRVFAAIDRTEILSRQEGVALVQIGLFSPGFTNLQTTLCLSQSAASRLVDRLTARGLTLKSAHPEDPREKILTLTSRGAELMRDILEQRRAALGELLAPLDSGETADLLRLTAKVLAGSIRSQAESDLTCRMCDLGKCPQENCPARHNAERPAAVTPLAPRRLPAHLL